MTTHQSSETMTQAPLAAAARRTFTVSLLTLTLAALAAPSHAAAPPAAPACGSPNGSANLVYNGSFEQYTAITPSGSATPATSFSIDNTHNGGSVSCWTTGGYNFLYASASEAVNKGAWTPQFNGYTQMWAATDSPVAAGGSHFIAADGAFQVGAISQVIGGMTAGNQYDVSFYWAAAQQSGFTGPTTDQWQVSLGTDSQATQIVTNPSKGFTGWMYTTMTFTAKNASDTLSFLAIGTPSGQPPFALLDGVTMVSRFSVPEPGTMLLLGSGLAAFAGLRRRRARVG